MWRALLILLGIGLWGANTANAASVAGVWLTNDGDAWIEIAPCGEYLCGTIRRLLEPQGPDEGPWLDTENPDAARRDQPVLGLTILTQLSAEPDANGVHRGGRIYDPKSGKTYGCKLSLTDEGNLRFRGYLGWSLLGHTTIWTPAPFESPH